MPFGKRVGTPGSVAALLPGVMEEFARVCRCGTGRAVFLVRRSKPLQHVRRGLYGGDGGGGGCSGSLTRWRVDGSGRFASAQAVAYSGYWRAQRAPLLVNQVRAAWPRLRLRRHRQLGNACWVGRRPSPNRWGGVQGGIRVRLWVLLRTDKPWSAERAAEPTPVWQALDGSNLYTIINGKWADDNERADTSDAAATVQKA